MITPNPQKKLLPITGSLPVQTLPGRWEEQDIRLQVLRLDSLHPVVSGNKWFKLQEWLQLHLESNHPSLVTFGGAWSNHLVATAFACGALQIPCVGVVRGEEPAVWSATLLQCRDYGMQLSFIPRSAYARKDHPDFIASLLAKHGPATIVPEGGFSAEGAKGAAGICSYIPPDSTHLCCAAGTGTTAAGLLLGKLPHQQVIVLPVLKGLHDLTERLRSITGRAWAAPDCAIQDGYHFGGYARYSPDLLETMNRLHKKYAMPTDFVYTGKLMAGILQLLEKDYFPAGSRILCIHSGGLQGNRSLPAGQLIF
jgi:1-aminocyclopropane-1-carboxylate deaminase/D-cysteine desulfhydrase-like pyridoxal-dependent ACC family enzyme